MKYELDELLMREYCPEIGDESIVEVFGGATLQIIHDDNGVHCHQLGSNWTRVEPKVSLRHKVEKWFAGALDGVSARIHNRLEE